MNNAQQHHTTANTYLTAEQGAEYDVQKVKWFFIGFLGNILGILIASIYEPTPPASRLLGKSNEYIASYIDTYKAKCRRIQVNQSAIGFVVACGLGILLAIITS